MIKVVLFVSTLLMGCSKQFSYEMNYDSFPTLKNTGGFNVNKLKLVSTSSDSVFYDSESIGYLICKETSAIGKFFQHPNMSKLSGATDTIVLDESLFKKLKVTCSSDINITQDRSIYFNITKTTNFLGIYKKEKKFSKVVDAFVGRKIIDEKEYIFSPNLKFEIIDLNKDQNLDLKLISYYENFGSENVTDYTQKKEYTWSTKDEVFKGETKVSEHVITKEKYALNKKKIETWKKNNIGKSFIKNKDGKWVDFKTIAK